MKLGIVGSRDFVDYQLFCKAIDQFLTEWNIDHNDIEFIISGGALGADTLAQQWATDNNHQMKIFYPDWKSHGRAAGPMRNQLIIDNSTHIIAFPSVSGKGTQDSIKKAKKANKKIKALWFDATPEASLED